LREEELWLFINKLLQFLHEKRYSVYGSVPLHYNSSDLLFLQYTPNQPGMSRRGLIFKIVQENSKPFINQIVMLVLYFSV